jgi:hypothetical protein
MEKLKKAFLASEGRLPSEAEFNELLRDLDAYVEKMAEAELDRWAALNTEIVGATDWRNGKLHHITASELKETAGGKTMKKVFYNHFLSLFA